MIFSVTSKLLACVLVSAVICVELVNSQSPNGFWGFEEWRHFFGGMAPNNVETDSALPRTMSDVQLPAHIPPHIADALNKLNQEINNGKQDGNAEPDSDFFSSRPKHGMSQFPINRFVDDSDDVTSPNPMSIPPVRLYQQNNVLVNIERIIKRNSPTNSKKKEAHIYLSQHYLPKATSSQYNYHKPEVPTLEYPNINTVAELPDLFKAVYKDILNKAIKDATIFKTPYSDNNVYKNALTPQLFTNEILFRDVQAKAEGFDTTTRGLLLQNRMTDDNEGERLKNAYSPPYKPSKIFIDRSSFVHSTTVNSASKTETNNIPSEIMDFLGTKKPFIENRDKKPDRLESEIDNFPNIESYKNKPQYNGNNTTKTSNTDREETPMKTSTINSNHLIKSTSSQSDRNIEPIEKQHLKADLNDNYTPKNNIFIQTDNPNEIMRHSSPFQPENTTRLPTSSELKNIMFQEVNNMVHELEDVVVKQKMANNTVKNKDNIIGYVEAEIDVVSSTKASNSTINDEPTTVYTPLLTLEEFRNIIFKGIDNTSHQYDVKENVSHGGKINVQKKMTPNEENINLGQVDEGKDALSVNILRNLTSGNDTLALNDEFIDKTNLTNSDMDETPKEPRLLINLLNGIIYDDITNEFGDNFSERDSIPETFVPEPSSGYKLYQDMPDIVTDSSRVEINDTISPELINRILASYNADTSETNPDTDLYENIDFQDFLQNDLILKQGNNNISKPEANSLQPPIVHNTNKNQLIFETVFVTTIGPRSSKDVANGQIDVPLLELKDNPSETSIHYFNIHDNDQNTTAENIRDDFTFGTDYANDEMPLSRSNDIDDLEIAFSNSEYTTPNYGYSSTQSDEMIFTERIDSATNNGGDYENVTLTETSRKSSVTRLGDDSSITTKNTVSAGNKRFGEGSVKISNSGPPKIEQEAEHIGTAQPISESYITQGEADIMKQTGETVTDNSERYKYYQKTINNLNNVIRHLDSLNFTDNLVEETNLSQGMTIEEERSLLDMNNASLSNSTRNKYPDISTAQIFNDEDTIELIAPAYEIFNTNNSNTTSGQFLHGNNETDNIQWKEISNPEKSSTDKSYINVSPYTETTMDSQNFKELFFPETREYSAVTDTISVATEREDETSIKVKISKENRNLTELSGISNVEVSSTDTYTTFFPTTETAKDTNSITELLSPEIREYSTVADIISVTTDDEDETSIIVKKNNHNRSLSDLSEINDVDAPSTDAAYTTYFPYTETTMDIQNLAKEIFPEVREYSAVTDTISVTTEREGQTNIEVKISKENRNLTELSGIANVELSSTDTYTTFFPYTETAKDMESITKRLSPETREYSIISLTTGDEDETRIKVKNNNENRNLSDLSEISDVYAPSSDTAYTTFFPNTATKMDTQNFTTVIFPETREYDAVTDTISVATENETSIKFKISKENRNLTELSEISNVEVSSSNAYTTFFPYMETARDMESITELLSPESREYSMVADIISGKTDDEVETSIKFKKNNENISLSDLSETSDVYAPSSDTAYTTLFPYTATKMDTQNLTTVIFPESREYDAVTDTTSVATEIEDETSIKVKISKENRNLTELSAISNVELSSTDTYTTFFPYTETAKDMESITELLSPKTREYSMVADFISVTTDDEVETSIKVKKSNENRSLSDLSEIYNLDTLSTDTSYTTFLPYAATTMDTQNLTTVIFPESREYDAVTDTISVATESEDETSIKVKISKENRNLTELSGISNVEVASTGTAYTTFFPYTETVKDMESITELFSPETTEYFVVADIIPVTTDGEHELNIKAKNSRNEKINFTKLLDISNTEVSSTDAAPTTFLPYTETTTMSAKSITEVFFPETREYSMVADTISAISDHENETSSKVKKTNENRHLSDFSAISNVNAPSTDTAYTTFSPYTETTMGTEGITEAFSPETRELSVLADTISATPNHEDETSVQVKKSNGDRNLSDFSEIYDVDAPSTDTAYNHFFPYTETKMGTKSVMELFFPHTRAYSAVADTISVTPDDEDEMSISVKNSNENRNFTELSDNVSTTNFSNNTNERLTDTKIDQDSEVSAVKEDDVKSVPTTEQTVFYESSEAIDTTSMYNSNVAADSSHRSATEIVYTTSLQFPL